jgi:endonuclease YncB( thermonuclease family)
MIKKSFFAGCVLSFATASLSTTAATHTPDGCPDPIAVNQAYELQEGVVVDVLDAVTLMVDIRAARGILSSSNCSGQACLRKVRLVNLDEPSYNAFADIAKRAFASKIQSQHVSMMLSPVQNTVGSTNSLVSVGDQDINEEQLELGHATFRSFGRYAIDPYTECKFLNAESRAKAKHLGVWSKP